ncbi:MAG: hypothetical protein ACJ788_01520, partial [Ktedonobacteraceae bacterium]
KYKNTLPPVVPCVVYPTDQQDIADSWIQLKHTGENQGVGTVPWDSVQKQRFESRHTGQEPRTLQVLEFLKANGIDVSGIEATNLERLLGTRGVPQMLGIDFPRGKKFLLIEPQEEVLQKLKKVVEHISAEDFAVGQIYTAPQRLKWIQNVLTPQPTPPSTSVDISTPSPAPSNGATPTPAPQPVPLPSNGGTGTQQSTSASVGTSTLTPPQPALPPAPSGPGVYYTLVNPTKLLPATIPTKIVKIYKELQIVNITGQRAAPHAVGALLRILVEITAQEYLMKTQGFYPDKNNHFRNPKDPGKPVSELRGKLEYIANNCGLPGNIAQVLRTLLGRQLMTAELNQVMHNTIFTADAAAIKGIWQNYENVFDYLIGEMQ